VLVIKSKCQPSQFIQPSPWAMDRYFCYFDEKGRASLKWPPYTGLL
jgi:hypothetical protein